MQNIPLFKVFISKHIDQPLLKVLHSGWIGQGPKVKEFEEALSSRFNSKYPLTLSAGTHGLSLALRLCDVQPGDEVITTPLTCTATNMPILMHGGKIVWADIKSDMNIDPDSIIKKITPKTKVIMAMHWGGYPCDMEEIRKIADEHNLFIIEDAAHAYGSTYKDSVIGDCRYSNFTMMSFQAIKHLTTVDGGVLFCQESHDYHRGKLLRWYGIDRESPRTDFRCEEDIQEWGYKYHMNDVAAQIGLVNMPEVEDNIQKTISNANYYNDEFGKLDGINVCQFEKNRQSSYWIYTVQVENRSEFCYMMGSKGIAVSRVHERNDKHSFTSEFRTELPMLEYVIDRMICIPVGWWVTKEQREYIVDCVKGGW